jgi:hypothetical protein
MVKSEGEPLRKTLKPQNLLLSEHTDNKFKIKNDFDSKAFYLYHMIPLEKTLLKV